MEFLNEKRVMSSGFPVGADDLLESKICFIERQMQELKKNCVKLYAHHYYEDKLNDYDKVLTNATDSWFCIRNCDWSGHTEILNTFKAKAACLYGSVFVGRQEYDEALRYLTEGKDLMEKDTLQYIMPEFYVRTAIEMAKCYLEKRSPTETYDDDLKKAKTVLRASERRIRENYQAFYYEKLSLELSFQRLFAAMNKHTFDQKGSERTAWECLKETEGQYRGLSDSADFPDPRSISYEKWKENQDVSLRTTKGEFFKNLYFAVGEKLYSLDNGEKDRNRVNVLEVANILKEELNGPEDVSRENDDVSLNSGCRYEKAIGDKMEQVLRSLQKCNEEVLCDVTAEGGKPQVSKEALQTLQECCLKIAFTIFADTIAIEKYRENTICLDDIAALLYDYSDKEEENAKNALLLGMIEKDLCSEYKKETVAKCIEAILDKVLSIEKINMFALSIKAEMAPSSRISEKIDDYPALRQSALKKCFFSLSKNGIPDDLLQKMELFLIRLYRHVTRFMNHAIIDWKADKWEGLEVGHYTRMAVLPKLYNKSPDTRLRIHNVHHLNDPLEGVLFINQMKERFAEKKQIAKDGEISLIDTLWKIYDSDKSGAARNTVYMGSFTSRLDHLNMWERYGDHQKGVALQFDGRAYFDKEAKISLAKMDTSGNYGHSRIDDTRYPLYMVLYLPEENGVDFDKAKEYAKKRAKAADKSNKVEFNWWEMQSELIGELRELEEKISVCLEEIQGIVTEMDKRDKQAGVTKEIRYRKKEEICHVIMVILDLVRFLIKNDKYRDEREFRVIQYSDNPECEGDGTEVPRLYIPIEKEPVYKKVCFGPLVTEFESKAAYVLNIRRSCSGEDGGRPDVEVRKSAISFKEG